METPGSSPELPELRKLTARQKANFIYQKLEHNDPYQSQREWEQLEVDLINSGLLTWQVKERKPAKLPPQRGVVTKVIYNRHVPNHKTTMPDGFLVDFTSTSQITGIDYAVFGPNAFEVTQDGRLIIDCTKAEIAKGGIQVQLPNFFVDKAENP